MSLKENLSSFFKKKGIDVSIVSESGTFPLKIFHLVLNGISEIAHITKITKEIGLTLKALEQPIIIPEYKTGTIRLEMILGDHPIVNFNKLLQEANLNDYKLPVILGTFDVSNPFIFDLYDFPHLLIGGTTGSGKSMLLHSCINTLMLNAKLNNINFRMMDPKQVEFTVYENSSRLSGKIASKPEECSQILIDLIHLMDERLGILKKAKCRDANEYRMKKGNKKFSYEILIIDELADLVQISGKKFLTNLTSLAQKCRAVGIHIIVATQHPSAKVVPGELKANFPYRIGCRVAAASHSRVLFDRNGAEKLLGNGDALISGGSLDMQRFRGALVDFKEVAAYQKHLNKNFIQRIFNRNAIFN